MKPMPAAEPGLRVQRLRVVAEPGLGPAEAEAFGVRFATALYGAVHALAADRRLHVRELTVRVGAAELADPQACGALAQAVARRIVERLPD